jgi:AhpD family alkylhydroperoxidase
MSHLSYEEYRRFLGRRIKQLRANTPEAIAGFDELRVAALAGGLVDGKTKELIALGIAITSGCNGCLAYHVHEAVRAGISRRELEEVIGVAVLMGGGPALMYGAEALEAFDQFEIEHPQPHHPLPSATYPAEVPV